MKYQIARVVGIVTQNGQKYVKVQSLTPEEQCRKEGTLFEWLINEFSLMSDPEMTRLRLGIDHVEYDRLLDELQKEN